MAETIRHKKLVKNLGKSRSMKEAMEKTNYSKSYSENPKQIQNTKGFKKAVKPVLKRYELELGAIQDAMELKNKDDEQYKTLVDAADKIQKQIQLLSGGVTERREDIFNDEQLNKIAERISSRERSNGNTPSEEGTS